MNESIIPLIFNEGKSERRTVYFQTDANKTEIYKQAASQSNVTVLVIDEGKVFDPAKPNITVGEGNRGFQLYYGKPDEIAKFWRIEKELVSQQ